MSKKLVKLTESDLHNIIKESVNTILNEMDYRSQMASLRRKALSKGDNLDDRWDEYDKQRGYRPFHGLQHHLFDDEKDTSDEKFKERQNEYSWDLLNDINRAWHNEEGNTIPSRNNPTIYYNPNTEGEYERENWVHGIQSYRQDLKNDFDKQWGKSKEVDKYTKQANSHPLHRKGSLNREL